MPEAGSAQQLTPEQIAASFDQQLSQLLARIDNTTHVVSEQAGKYVTTAFAMFRAVIEVQGKELALYKELEHYIVTETLDERLWISIAARLQTLRAEAAQAAKSAQIARAANS